MKAENDWTSEQVARYPDRLRGFCGFNPLKDYALDELARCAKDPQLRHGLKLHFGNSAIDYHNPQHVARVRQVFAAANTHHMSIVAHMRASISRKLAYGRDAARIFLDELVPAAPDVTIQIAHLAGAGGYDDPPVDEALSVFVDAIAKGDARARRLYFDVTQVACTGCDGGATSAAGDTPSRTGRRARALRIRCCRERQSSAKGSVGGVPPAAPDRQGIPDHRRERSTVHALTRM